MTTKQIYHLAIREGIKYDPRDKSLVEESMERAKQKYSQLTKEEQNFFDKERFKNPYSDSRIHVDNNKKKIKRALVTIDITSGGIMLAKEIGADLIINHHPVGKALQGLDDVMRMQADILEMYGVPINVAEGLLKKRISEVARGIHASNSFVAVDTAKQVKVDLINIHTPADNCVSHFVEDKIKRGKPRFVYQIIEILNKIPEYQEAAYRGSPPTIFSGSKENRAGKIAITEMTGGTEGSSEMFEKLANAGIGTDIAMHLSEKHCASAKKANINVVVASHIASDSVGMNLIADKIEQKGVEIIPAGGFIRNKRKS